jgi:hypothetical protein
MGEGCPRKCKMEIGTFHVPFSRCETVLHNSDASVVQHGGIYFYWFSNNMVNFLM